MWAHKVLIIAMSSSSLFRHYLCSDEPNRRSLLWCFLKSSNCAPSEIISSFSTSKVRVAIFSCVTFSWSLSSTLILASSPSPFETSAKKEPFTSGKFYRLGLENRKKGKNRSHLQIWVSLGKLSTSQVSLGQNPVVLPCLCLSKVILGCLISQLVVKYICNKSSKLTIVKKLERTAK